MTIKVRVIKKNKYEKPKDDWVRCPVCAQLHVISDVSIGDEGEMTCRKCGSKLSWRKRRFNLIDWWHYWWGAWKN